MEELYVSSNYPSATRFYKILKEKGIKATHKQVKDFIKKQSVAQVHHPVQRNRNKEKYIVASSPYEILQIDLLDYQKYSKKNKGFRYILICVDVFTRKAFAEPIKSKTPKQTTDAMIKILSNVKPKMIESDNGSEWKGSFQELMKEENIIHITNEVGDHNSLGIIDRFSRTIKTEISKYMTGNNTTKWTGILPSLIENYNKTPHKAIEDIKPNEASSKKYKYEIGTLNYEKGLHNQQVEGEVSNTIKVGDRVRIQRKKNLFDKGYEITYSKEIYEVIKTDKLKAKLSNGKTYKKTALMEVGNSKELSKAKEAVEKKTKQKRKLRKEGVSKKNIETKSKRKRKKRDMGAFVV